MHNKKNIVLMFLIVMLSFAIVSEVSAVALDEAEPAESGLNEPYGSFHSSGPQMPGERFHEVSQWSFDDSLDGSHSNNNQTSLRDVHDGTDGNMNFYEQDSHEMPLEQRYHDVESQKPQADFDALNSSQGEKMNDGPMDFNNTQDLGFRNNGFVFGNDMHEPLFANDSELLDNMSKMPIDDAFTNRTDLRFNDTQAPGFVDNESVKFLVILHLN